MPRTRTQPVAPLSVRLTSSERDELKAIAWDMSLDATPAEERLDEATESALIRRILGDYKEMYFEHVGGREALLARWRDSQLEETTKRLKELEALRDSFQASSQQGE